jgi:thiamine biosynthesis lipoprotein
MIRIALFISVASLLVMQACSNESKEATLDYYKISGPAQGSTYNITVESNQPQLLQQKIDSLIERIDVSMSTYREDSYISAWNNANVENQELDAHFKTVLDASIAIAEETGGYFDPTVVPLLELWGFGKKQADQVSPEEIEESMQFVGYQKLIDGSFSYKKGSEGGLMLNFNAIAQGYTVDEIADLLLQESVTNFMVELGGEVRVQGINKEGMAWSLGIEKPLEGIEEVTRAEDRFEFILKMPSGKSLATSGSYRNYRIDPANGQAYSHIINPLTGYATKDRLLSVSVVSDHCMRADALATALMAMGLKQAIEFTETVEGDDFLLIYLDESGKKFDIYRSEGMTAISQQMP